MSPELSQLAKELLASLPWSVVLPAGCGKTELIAAIAANVKTDDKPILVLTHTNAGVDVVRKRFSKYNVLPTQARVFTLDTWAKLFDDHFPLLGSIAIVPAEADLWLGVRLRAKEIFCSPHIGDIISATYSAVIVDEYQDCSDLQHSLVVAMSQFIPVGVLGDPLQGIFDFGEGIVDWVNVENIFPTRQITAVPHRWATNPALGKWLLEIRPLLIAGSTIDFRTEDIPVIWRQSTSDLSNERIYCLNAANTADNQKQITALRQLPAQCHKFARVLLGRFEVAEEIECKVAKGLMLSIDNGDGGKVAAATIKFAKECCNGLPTFLNNALITSYSRGIIKTYRSNNTNAALFDALNLLVTAPTAANVMKAIRILEDNAQRIFRGEAWRTTKKVLDELVYSQNSAVKTLENIRNRSRYGGQFLKKHSISRTLLVKGQEYDECIIIGADGMSARNLYVALSRGVDKVTIFSSSPVLTIQTF